MYNYNNEKIEWMNQENYVYRDNKYDTQTNFVMKTCVCAKKELMNISPAMLSISLYNTNNNTNRSLVLKYEQIDDLIYAIEQTMAFSNPKIAFKLGPFHILRRYDKGKTIKITFKQSSQNANEKIVIFRLIYNEMEYSTIVIPLHTFTAVYELLKDFKQNFTLNTMELSKRLIDMKMISDLNKVNRNLIELPNKILSGFDGLNESINDLPKQLFSGFNEVNSSVNKVNSSLTKINDVISELPSKLNGIIQQPVSSAVKEVVNTIEPKNLIPKDIDDYDKYSDENENYTNIEDVNEGFEKVNNDSRIIEKSIKRNENLLELDIPDGFRLSPDEDETQLFNKEPKLLNKTETEEDQKNSKGVWFHSEQKNEDVTNMSFDTFVNDIIDTVEVSEINKAKDDIIKKTSSKKEASVFIKDYLDNDLANYEANILKMTACIDCHLDFIVNIFANDVKESIPIEDIYAGMNKQNIFAYSYMTQVDINDIVNIDKNENTGLPLSANLHFCNYNNIQPENIDLAYDLCLINIYLKCFRNKVEETQSSSKENRSLLYLVSRHITDVFSTFMLMECNYEMIKSCIRSRFKEYSEYGFFKAYTGMLEKYPGNRVISEQNIIDELERYKKIFDLSSEDKKKHNSINQLIKYNNLNTINHFDSNFNTCRIPLENNYTVEDICQFSLVESTWKQMNRRTFNNILNAHSEKSETKQIEIFDKTYEQRIDHMFNKFLNKKHVELLKNTDKNIKSKKISKRYVSVLHRLFIEPDFSIQIIPSKREYVINYVKEIGQNKFVCDKYLDLEDFGKILVKGIYVWNGLSDSEKKNLTYSNFRSKIECCSMDKEMVIDEYKYKPEFKSQEDDEWTDFLQVEESKEWSS